MMAAAWVGVIVAVAVAGMGGAAVAAPRAASPPAVGRVSYVTDKRAYLDRGALDGLKPRQLVQLFRGGRAATTCAVERVADHQATCTGGRPREGDSFRVATRRAPASSATGAAVPELPPLVDDETLAARADAVAATALDKVDFDGRHATRARPSAEVGPSIVVWQSQPTSPADYAQQRIDGAIRAVDLGLLGMRADAAFTAMRWQSPGDLERFRPGTPTQFYLWEAELSRRRTDGNTVFAAGRLWPWHAPGLTVLDGVQIGRQNDAETAEGGAYAGLVPTALGLAPATDSWAAGLYGALVEAAPRRRSGLRRARQEARLGIWRPPATSGLVAEGEGLAQLWIGPWTLGGGGRVRWAPDSAGQSVLDRAYLDLGLRPSLTFGVGLHMRYFGATPFAEAPLRGEMPALQGSAHAIADAHWEVTSWLGLTTFAGAHLDRDTNRGQLSGAGEIRFPRALGNAGGASLGGQVDEGWLRARTAYLQAVVRARERLQILARVSGSYNQFETPDQALDIVELGGYAHVDGAITSWLRLRAWSLLRLPVSLQGQLNPGAGYGTVLGGSATGRF